MAEDDKVKLELDLPKDQVSIHAANEVGGPEVAKEIKENSEVGEDLKKTRRQLAKVRKERDELKEKQESEDDESIVKQATGYELGEIVAAPLRPPEAEAKKRPVRGQLRSLIIGFALAMISLIALPIFGFTVFISIALVGAALVAIGVLVRI